jgi:hypothetical protein
MIGLQTRRALKNNGKTLYFKMSKFNFFVRNLLFANEAIFKCNT